MKIGIETSSIGNKVSGASRYIDCLLEQINNSGNEIKTYSNQNYFGKRNFLLKKYRGIDKHVFRLLRLSNEMNKDKIDCAIFPDYFMPFNFNLPSAVTIHDLSFITHPEFYSSSFVTFYKYNLKKTIQQNPLIVTVSEFSKEQISKYLGIKKENIFLLQRYPQIKNHQAKPDRNNSIKREAPYFLYVGHVEPRKNLGFMVKNFLEWKETRGLEMKLKIVGEVWIKSREISELLKKYKNCNDIEFTGYIEEDALFQVYQNASGFLHTSLVEGFGLPVLEALHFGLPVLCSSNTATAEISYPYSIIVNPEDDKSMIDGLDKLFESTPSKNNQRYSTYLPAKQVKFTPELVKEQLEEILDVLEKKVKKHSYYSACQPAKQVTKAFNAEQAIEKTLLYSKLFNAGIKKNKIFEFLFDVKLNRQELEDVLVHLCMKEKIYEKDNFIYLNNSVPFSYNKNGALKKLNRTKKILFFLKVFPLISAISFSGGTAHYGFGKHDDVDIFIIAKPNSVYINYFIIHLLSLLMKVRKEICANYLIDETKLEISSPHDFYTAHQIISLVPFKNSYLLNSFWSYNKWVNDFFPNFNQDQTTSVPERQENISKLYLLLKPINFLFKQFYKMLYRKKLWDNEEESLKLESNCLKLHTNDHRLKITTEFEKYWNKHLEEDKSSKASLRFKKLIEAL